MTTDLFADIRSSSSAPLTGDAAALSSTEELIALIRGDV
jgi:hypothetical protein